MKAPDNKRNAPDKIYLWETQMINGGYDPAWHKNSFNDSDVEYICKDALLEWAKEKQNESLTIVADDVWQEVIDKLNSI